MPQLLRKLFAFPIIFVFCNLFFSGCQSRSIIENPTADIVSTLEVVSSQNTKKAEISRKLPKRIGNMELFKVVDYTKRFIIGIDMGYGVFYDLKEGKKGSGNIYLYSRDQETKVNGLNEEALAELHNEQKTLQHGAVEKGNEIKVIFNGIPFYKIHFITPPDAANNQYLCYGFITVYNSIFIKVIFFYPKDASYGETETDKFMNELTIAISK